MTSRRRTPRPVERRQQAGQQPIELHCHVPSTMHMGDCVICGNVREASVHLPKVLAPRDLFEAAGVDANPRGGEPVKDATREAVEDLLDEINRNAAAGFLTIRALTLATTVQKALSREPREPEAPVPGEGDNG